MINTSNEYKRYITDSVDSTLSREFVTKADITLADGTVLNVTDADIVKKGLKISDATSPSNSFQIGSAIINQCILMLNNIGGKFDQYDFTGAIIRPYKGLKLTETTEILKKGVFTVDEPTLASSIISLVALDNMEKFDTPFSEVTISFPCTQLQLLQVVCLHCGVPLATVTFTNSDFMVTRRPSDEATTCREIVSWIAQDGGNFAKCNVDGALELKWYDFGAFESSDNLDGGRFDSATPYATGDNADGGNFTDYNSGDNFDGGTFLDMDRYHHIYSLGSATIGTDDVIITGVEVKAMGTESDYGETVLFGSKGYVIQIDKNPLITEGTASLIANTVGAKIVGMRFRPCSVSAISDPSREAGDVAYLSHKGNAYQILLTSVSSQIGNNDNISCDAETPSKKQSVRFDAATKTIIEVRKIAKDEIKLYDLVQKEFNNLVFHSFGLFYSEEVLEDGSTIKYGHDQPTLAESQNIWKQTADAFSVSDDGGINFRGMDAKGNILANVLTAIGVNAEWIKVLTSFTVGDFFSVDKFGKLKAINAEISGKIIAEMGKIGPYLIDEFGIESDVVRLSEHPMFPGLRFRKKGDSGGYVNSEDNNSREMNLQSGYQEFETINDGVKTVISITGKNDSEAGIDGSIRIVKIDVSGEFEKAISSIRLSETSGIETRQYDSNGITTRMARLLDSAVELEHDGHTGKVILNGDGSMNIGAGNNDVYIGGASISNIMERLDELERRL